MNIVYVFSALAILIRPDSWFFTKENSLKLASSKMNDIQLLKTPFVRVRLRKEEVNVTKVN
jgi:hypothetical protein